MITKRAVGLLLLLEIAEKYTNVCRIPEIAIFNFSEFLFSRVPYYVCGPPDVLCSGWAYWGLVSRE
jgi:hypothetical protein